MESSSTDDGSASVALRDALEECVKQASLASDPSAAEKSLRPARAAVLGLSLEEYDDLNKKCADKLQVVIPHVRKYNAEIRDSIILMKVGQWKVGISIPLNRNTSLRQNSNAKIYYEVLTSEIDASPNLPCQSSCFSRMTDMLRFIASLKRM